jgi:hypothetical protein
MTTQSFPADNSKCRSVGIRAWAAEQALEIEWASGEIRGWSRRDGERAIETNGDPVFESDDGFEAAWDARGLV